MNSRIRLAVWTVSITMLVGTIAVAQPRWRLTITPRVLQGSRRVLVLVAGKEKAEMVAQAVSGPWRPEEVPVQLARHATWLVDREAASGLGEDA